MRLLLEQDTAASSHLSLFMSIYPYGFGASPCHSRDHHAAGDHDSGAHHVAAGHHDRGAHHEPGCTPRALLAAALPGEGASCCSLVFSCPRSPLSCRK